MMTLSSIIDPLRAANRLSRLPLFSWKIVSVSGKPIRLTCGIEIKADGALDGSAQGDLLVVVAGFNERRHAPNSALPTLRAVAQKHHTIFGIEAGTWVLARAEIIRTHRVTTHWEDLESLSFTYPELDVIGQRYVIEENIWTSGGASPALDMMLHYIRTTQNRSLALDVASAFIYNESSAASDTQAIVSLGRMEQAEPRLAQAIHLMEQNIEEPLSITDIAKQLKLSTRSLELLSNKHLGVAPGAYYLRLRLQAARRLVLDTNSPITDIAVRSGFNSAAALSRAFKQRYGVSPMGMRRGVVG
ncbi:MAG: GlxA family transcriptional regulator [Gammaproteobacteria bacterium]|nr:GlxA family transcriptional regulator [Gammaproteobacteria bacterium]